MIPTQFLFLAERLLQNEKCAEGLRTAISRAYYAAFNEAKNFLERVPGVKVTSGSACHADVQRHFVNLGDLDVEKIGHDLATLHTWRLKADYKLSASSVEGASTALLYVTMAREICGKITTCKSAAKMSALSPAILKNNKLLREGAPAQKKS